MKLLEKNFLIKKLLYQSKNRGYKENNLILGQFAEKFIREMDISMLQQFSIILSQEDSDIYDWLTRKKEPPIFLCSPLMSRLLKFAIDNNNND